MPIRVPIKRSYDYAAKHLNETDELFIIILKYSIYFWVYVSLLNIIMPKEEDAFDFSVSI